MQKEYDISKMKSHPNPYAKRLKKLVTLRMEEDIVEYFKNMSEETGIPGANVKRKAVPLFQPRSGYERSGTAFRFTLASRLMLVAYLDKSFRVFSALLKVGLQPTG